MTFVINAKEVFWSSTHLSSRAFPPWKLVQSTKLTPSPSWDCSFCCKGCNASALACPTNPQKQIGMTKKQQHCCERQINLCSIMIIIETWQIVRYYCEIGSLASHLLVSDRGKEIKLGSQAASPISITGSWWWYDTSAISGNLPCLFGSDAWSLSFLRSARLKAWLLASGLTSEPWKIGSKKVGICETIFGSLDPNPSIVPTTGTFTTAKTTRRLWEGGVVRSACASLPHHKAMLALLVLQLKLTFD